MVVNVWRRRSKLVVLGVEAELTLEVALDAQFDIG